MGIRGRGPKVIKYRHIGSGHATPVDIPTIETYKPHRKPETISDVWVPFMQALVTSLLVTTTIAATIQARRLDSNPWLYIALASLIMFLAWMWTLGSIRDTLWTIESTLAVDIDRDSSLGEPEPRIITMRGPETENAIKLLERDQLLDKFSMFVRGCEAGSTAMDRWDKQIGRDTYCHWRDVLISLQWAAWNNPEHQKQGWRLKFPADDIIEAINSHQPFADKFQ